MSDLVLDASRSRVTVHTYAEGLFAKLAHDLELACEKLTGTATRKNGAEEGDASIEAPLAGFAITGVLHKDGSVDERGLSPTDKREALAKMHHDVFHARPEGVVRVEAHAAGGSARVRLVPPNGKAIEIVTRPTTTTEGLGLRAKGSFEVSLSAIGSDVVKGPMGAFRVKDKVLVKFDVVFAPA